MSKAFDPTLFLLVLPLGWLAWKSGVMQKPWPRRAAWAVLAAVTAWSLPWGRGVEFADLPRLNLLLAAATALLLWAAEGEPSKNSGPWRGLPALAALSVAVYLNFFAFHGERTFVHLHDVAHYYLGSKYYPELEYGDLYVAMLRAEAEVYDDHFKTIQARDLRQGQLGHIRPLLQSSEPIRQRFSPQRWQAFRTDVSYFREALGAQYPALLQDHGFNPTPAWALLGMLLTNWTPAGSPGAILALTLLDPILLLGMFCAVGWAFGRRKALLALIFFCVAYGAGFGWTGGALLRFPWLACLTVSVCAFRKKRYGWAGALLAVSAMFRVFPALFALPLLLKAAMDWHMGRPQPRRRVRFFAALASTALALLLATAWLPRGWSNWLDFRRNMEVHLGVISPNHIGLNRILAYQDGPEQVSGPELAQITERRNAIYRAQLWVFLLPALLLVYRLTRFYSDGSSFLLAFPLIFATLNLAGYYYVFLLAALLLPRRHPIHLMPLFAFETLCYLTALFQDRVAMLFLYRSVLAGLLIIDLHLPALLRLTPWHSPASLQATKENDLGTGQPAEPPVEP